MLLGKNIIFDPGQEPPDPLNRSKTAAPGPQTSPNNPRQSMDFEVGLGDRLATLKVSKATH